MAKEKAPKKQRKVSIPQTDENYIIVPDNLGLCPDNSVLILQDNAEYKTPGGILIPDGSVEKPETGIVVALGRRTTDTFPVEQEIGDRLFWGYEAGRTLRLAGQEYLLIRYNEIVWTIKH